MTSTMEAKGLYLLNRLSISHTMLVGGMYREGPSTEHIEPPHRQESDSELLFSALAYARCFRRRCRERRSGAIQRDGTSLAGGQVPRYMSCLGRHIWNSEFSCHRKLVEGRRRRRTLLLLCSRHVDTRCVVSV
jgi:hypothetical protein